jgi:hypothetical protein
MFTFKVCKLIDGMMNGIDLDLNGNIKLIIEEIMLL